MTYTSVCEYCFSESGCDHGGGTHGASPCACGIAGAARCPECGCECAAWDWGLGFVGPASIRSFFGVGDDENPGFSEYPASKSQLVAAAQGDLEEAEDVGPALEWLARTLPEGKYRDRGEAVAALSPVLSWAGNDPSQFVAALPMSAIATGTRLLVGRDQSTTLVGKDGTPLDSFGPGEHLLSRESAPRAAAKSRPPAPGLPRSTIAATPYFVSTKEVRALVRRTGRTGSGEPVDLRANVSFSIVSLSDFLSRSGRHTGGISTADLPAVVTAVLGPSLDQAIAGHSAKELAGSSPLIEQAIRAGAALAGLRVASITIEPPGVTGPADSMAAMLVRQRQAMAHLPPETQAMIQAQMAKAMEKAQAARTAGTPGAVAPPTAAERGPPPKDVRCAACQAPNPPGTKFCGGCGQPLRTKLACPRCGQETTPGLKFCGNCGSPLSGP